MRQAPEICCKIAEGMRRAWQDPEARRRMLEGIEASRAKQSEARRRQWRDPRYRERMVAAHLRHVPDELWGEYRRLRRKRFSKAEALAILGVA